MEKQDWHKADIIAALHKKGLSLASLSRANGLSSSTLANALTRDWPRGEIIIANAIGEEPQEIWPTRYFDKAGMPIKRIIRKPGNDSNLLIVFYVQIMPDDFVMQLHRF